MACIQGHLDIVKYLVRRAVNLHTLLPKGSVFMADTMNCLSAACSNDDENMIAFLFDNKVEVTESVIDCHTELIGKVLNR